MNKILRTLLLVIVALGLVLTIAACNNDKPGTTTTAPKGTTVAPVTGDNTTTAPKGTTTAPVTGDNTTTPNVTTAEPPVTTTPKGTTAGEPEVEYPYVDGTHEIDVDANGNLVYTKLSDWGKDLVIGNADETPYGTYTVTLTNWVKASNWVGYFFAGTGNGEDIWNAPAQAYVVAMREFDNAIVIQRLNGNGWHAEDTTVIANVEGYKNGKSITIKCVYYPYADVAKIDVYYLFGDSTEFVLGGTYTDANPFTGTEYGLKMSMRESTAKEFSYVAEYPTDGGKVTFTGEWLVNDGKYVSNSATSLLEIGNNKTKDGEYSATIKGLADSAQLDAALIFCAKDNVEGLGYWENDASYYALFVNDGKNLGLARMDNGWKGWLKEAAIPNYAHGDEVTVKAVVSSTGKIDCYANGELLFTVEVGADALYGTGYGIRAKVAGVTFSNIVTKSNNIEYRGTWNKNGDKYVSLSEAALIEIGKAETAVGTYKANITGDPNNKSLDAAIIFAARDNVEGIGYWEEDASYYAVMILNSGALGIARLNNGWGGWVENKLPAIPNYKHGDTVEVKAEVFPDGTVKCYANGELLITVNVGAENLYGTGYGYRSRIAGATFDSFEYTPMWDVVKGADKATLGADGSVSATDAYIALSNKKTDSVFGTYTLDFENTETARNGLVFGYSETDGVESYAFFWVNHDIAILNHTNIAGNKDKDVAFESSAWGWNGNAFSRAGRHQLTVSVADAGEGNATYKTYYDGTLITTWTGPAPTGTGYGIRADQGNIKAYSVTYTPEIRPETAGANGAWFGDTAEGVYTSATHAAIKVVGNAANVVGTYRGTMTTPDHATNSDSGLVFCASDNDDDGKFWENNGLYYFLMVSDSADIALVRVGEEGKVWNHVASGGKILNFRHGDTLNLAAVVYADGTIEIYANDILYITWKDAAPLTGTGYGVRAEVGGTTFTNVSYSETAEAIEAPATREDTGAYSKFTYADGTVEYMTKTYWKGSLKLGDVTSTHSTYEFTLRNGNSADNMVNFYIAGDDAAGEGTDVWAGSAYAIGFHASGALAITKLVGAGWNGQEKVWDGSYVIPGYCLDDEINVKVDYNLVNGVATIKVWIKGAADADYVLAAEVVDNAPLTGKAYGLKMPIGGSVCSNIKVTNVPTFVVTPGDSEDAA